MLLGGDVTVGVIVEVDVVVDGEDVEVPESRDEVLVVPVVDEGGELVVVVVSVDSVLITDVVRLVKDDNDVDDVTPVDVVVVVNPDDESCELDLKLVV